MNGGNGGNGGGNGGDDGGGDVCTLFPSVPFP